jgi:outer membrane protein
MKIISYALNVILLIAVIILYILHFNFVRKQSSSEEGSYNPNDTSRYGKGLSVAYINTDSVVSNYKYYTELKTKLENEQAIAENQVKVKAADLEKEYKLLSTKINLGLIKQEDAERSFAVKQQELELLRNNLSEQLIEKEKLLTEQLYDSIVNYVNRYNIHSKHTYILGYAKGGGIIYAPKSMDMTKEILLGLNNEYETKYKKNKK